MHLPHFTLTRSSNLPWNLAECRVHRFRDIVYSYRTDLYCFLSGRYNFIPINALTKIPNGHGGELYGLNLSPTVIEGDVVDNLLGLHRYQFDIIRFGDSEV